MEQTPPIDRGLMTVSPSPTALQFADLGQAKDLATLISRVRSIDSGAAVRLQARGNVLGVWVPVMSAETLLEQIPTVLGMRAIHLDVASEADVTVESAALLDRLARIEKTDGALDIPPVTVHAAWSGIIPPASRWSHVGTMSSGDVDAAAREGMSAVEQALPANPGGAVVSTVRARIWGSTTSFDMVTGAAFGATVLGFNDSGQDFDVYQSGPWHRLSGPTGHILSRPGNTL